ncbi:receptor homology region, transmembrane domain- and RING domain-containing protein 1-like isoform X2 [Phoenix dactylifera]|uniref:Receptor homology region, transmembrane domain- and RING domain-containing protein 1-like isoform X2 n=1 Tax=Phoenix dactylifera TaxID=42345 RepID=A0A8B7BQP6_PHODC|nr:receptor homology region, transmembrane domain- and RING domain-containing protein 1-like isoform X2 [Phoenix dactylifera]
MGLLNSKGSALFVGTLLCLLVGFAAANVVLIGRNVSLSFEDVEATFVAGSPGGIHIPAVFVSKASGKILKEYVGRADVELWIIPTFESSAWSIMAISFISLLAMSAVLATCFFVRRHRIRREQPSIPNVREFHGMSSQLVKAMPSLIFTSVLEDNCTSSTCAICLEDYRVGEKLRILPCRHKFHAFCVDSWLTTWRTFCPVCKQDARAGIANLPASECTPLLSSGVAIPSSTAALSSFHSSVASSPSSNIQIASTPPQSESTSRSPFLSIPPRIPHPHRSYNHSRAISISRSSADLRNASSHRSRSSHIVSPHSMDFPLSSPIHSRFTSPYIPGSSNASPSYLAGSSSRLSYLRHCRESGASLSALASAPSLPGC